MLFCSQGKLVARPSISKFYFKSPSFLQRIQKDICGPIHPLNRSLYYFTVLINASSRWSYVCLLSTYNVEFARLLPHIIKLRAFFLNHPIKTICLDNTGEFTSKILNDYCISVGIDVEHHVPHVLTQNGLIESLIKRPK